MAHTPSIAKGYRMLSHHYPRLTDYLSFSAPHQMLEFSAANARSPSHWKILVRAPSVSHEERVLTARQSNPGLRCDNFRVSTIWSSIIVPLFSLSDKQGFPVFPEKSLTLLLMSFPMTPTQLLYRPVPSPLCAKRLQFMSATPTPPVSLVGQTLTVHVCDSNWSRMYSCPPYLPLPSPLCDKRLQFMSATPTGLECIPAHHICPSRLPCATNAYSSCLRFQRV
jgi:hypothetical protein